MRLYGRLCSCIAIRQAAPGVAAVHAGWRGTVNFIVGHTLEQMRTVYGTEGSEVVACIGPGISLESFEVGDEVYDTFRLNGFDMSRISYRKTETGKYHIDLWEANRQQCLTLVFPIARSKYRVFVLIFIMMNFFRHEGWGLPQDVFCQE